MKKVHTNKGFTMAELLIVVAIIAIMVAVAIPTFGDQLEKSRQSTDVANLRDALAVARLAELENKVDGEAIKAAKNDSASLPETFTYYFNAGTGKLVKYTDATVASANGTKMRAQSTVLKLDANESLYYSYYDTAGVKQTKGPVDSAVKYLLTVDHNNAILKVTFQETGVNTLDFDVQSVTYVDPSLTDFGAQTDVAVTAKVYSTITAADQDIQSALTKPQDAVNPVFVKTAGPSWAQVASDTGAVTSTRALAEGDVGSYSISVLMIDENGRTATYKITGTINAE